MRTRRAFRKAGQQESHVPCVCDTHQVGRGSWPQDKSPQHPWMLDVVRKGGVVPGPGNYKTPPRKKAGGRISDASPITRDDYAIKKASQQPGPLEYAQLALVLPQASHLLLLLLLFLIPLFPCLLSCFCSLCLSRTSRSCIPQARLVSISKLQGGRMDPVSERPAPPGSHAGPFTRDSPGVRCLRTCESAFVCTCKSAFVCAGT